ncbi:MAG: ABC transporter permease [Ignavibacteriales bacterium]|nr:ABC transporter permease [Ignavibacteriales bacterium]MCF8306644.1 ABC transporter permease [Ignavibacteriales bacterium]MCF8316256.1 ABC transporter permease [Ignavibacteriales bacterium]MCF8437840.1 ABC transporter permease [Ignavibacteriales bacterium]
MIINFIIKEFIQFRRDPKMFVLILIAPVVQLTLLGYAVNFDVENVHTVVMDNSRSSESRQLLNKLKGSGYFSFESFVDNYQDLEEQIMSGTAIMGLVIPEDFSTAINTGKSAKIQTIFDGSDGNSASIASGYFMEVIRDFSSSITVKRFELSGTKVMPLVNLENQTRVWYNPELKTRHFMIPGIVGLLLMLITIILTSLAVVKEKEIGTFEQLIVTPLKPYQILIGKLAPFSILGFISVIIVLSAMRIIFGIPVKGSIVFLFFSSTIFIISTLGLGLFVSTISKNQQQAMMMAIFLVMMPMIFLSGFTFPIENMPWIIRQLTYLIPLRYFMLIIRGVILKGIGIAELWQELLVLFLMGIGIMWLASKRFSKRLE